MEYFSDNNISLISKYGKCYKISNILFIFWPIFLLFMQLFLKILGGMANRVDPD